MRTRFKNPSLSLESIAFQHNTMFFKELVMTFEQLAKLSEKEMADSEFVARLSQVVAHHTKMSIGFSLANIPPCIEIPMLDRNNVLINAGIKDWVNSSDGLRMIAAANDGTIRGRVNLRTGEVSGIFSEIKATIHLPTDMLTEKSKYTPEEMAGITLHEVGHLFTYFEYSSRMLATNQALAGMSKALDGANSPAEREIVFINVKKSLKLTDLDEKALSHTTNSRISEVVVISAAARASVHELGANIYDFSTWEYLADQYAARQGAGRHVVTALDKLYKGMYQISFRSSAGYLAMEAVKMALLFTVATSTTFGYLAINAAVIMIAMDGQGDGTYDLPGARFKRVRNQIVEALKDKKLAPEDVKRYQDDLDAIDKVLKHVNDRRQIIGVLWDMVNPWNYKPAAQKKFQQDLETIAANDLFAKAADFKNMA
ncbi:hypothetical protein D3C71_79350 [compost metagenome]